MGSDLLSISLIQISASTKEADQDGNQGVEVSKTVGSTGLSTAARPQFGKTLGTMRFVIQDQPAPAPVQTPDLPGVPPLPAILSQPREAVPDIPAPSRFWWFWSLGGVLAAGLGVLAWVQPWTAAVPVVGVEAVTLGPVSRVLAVNGRVAGTVSVEVRPLVSGLLLDVLVSEGDVVKQSQVLAMIDKATPAAVVRQAVASLDAALVAQADAKSTYARTEALGNNAARVVLETAARSEQKAEQEVARVTALLEQAQIQLSRFTIRAPIAGSVLAMKAEPGQTIDPSNVLLLLADLGHLVVETDVDETYATQIRIGQPAALQLAGETEVRQGHVSFVSQRVDAATGGLAIKLSSEIPLAAPIGLTVTANITVDDRANAITVPRAAIVRDDSGSGVFVVTLGVARRQSVAVINWPAARLIVTNGLSAGDLVIRDATAITDGLAVTVVP